MSKKNQTKIITISENSSEHCSENNIINKIQKHENIDIYKNEFIHECEKNVQRNSSERTTPFRQLINDNIDQATLNRINQTINNGKNFTQNDKEL